MSREYSTKEVINEWLRAQNVNDPDVDGEVDAEDDEGVDEVEGNIHSTPSVVLLRLADYHPNDWQYIKVSTRSDFGDLSWDFTDYHAPSHKNIKLNFDVDRKEGFNIGDPKYSTIRRLTQALLFYRIPHVNPAGRVKSYSSLISDQTKIIRVSAFCIELGIYDEHTGLTINDISASTIENYINKLDSASMKWEFAYMLRYWLEISSQGLFPDEFCLTEELVTIEQVSAYREQYDNQCRPYEPLPMDEYAAIFNHCALMIERYSNDCLWLYHTYKHSLVGAYDRPEKLDSNCSSYSPSDPLGVAVFKDYQPVVEGDSPWWPVRTDIRQTDGSEYVLLSGIARTVTSLVDACSLLILCVTGMRRSELTALMSDCLSLDETGHWLTYKVFKTSVASQGDVRRIPIPGIAAKAIHLLIELGEDSRKYGNHDYLLSKYYKTYFGCPAKSSSIEHSCRRIETTLGLGQRLHPHRFRKSLAMYIIHQDPRNIEVIRKLFSHTTLRMTLKYILSLPGVNEEVRRVIVEENSEILASILNAVTDKRIGGIGGKRILSTAENSPILKARLQNKGKESLSQYVASLLDEGVQLLHRTNLAICLKTMGFTSPTPCDPQATEHQAKLHPNIFACDPFNCRFAVFVEDNVPALKNEIIFHSNLIKHEYASENQISFSQKRISEAHKRLSEVVGEAADSFLRQVAYG